MLISVVLQNHLMYFLKVVMTGEEGKIVRVWANLLVITNNKCSVIHSAIKVESLPHQIQSHLVLRQMTTPDARAYYLKGTA